MLFLVVVLLIAAIIKVSIISIKFAILQYADWHINRLKDGDKRILKELNLMGSLLISSVIEIYKFPMGNVHDLVSKGYLELCVVDKVATRIRLTFKGQVIATRISPGFNYRRYRHVC